MKKLSLFLVLFFVVVSVVFSYETVDGVISGGGKVILNKDGTWEWKKQPDKYKGFNDIVVKKETKQKKVKIEKFNYTNLFRNAGKSEGKYFKIYGKVAQYMRDGRTYTVRLNTRRKSYYWDEDILINGYSGQPLIEDDLVEMVIRFDGINSYTTIKNTNRSVPFFSWTGDSTIVIKGRGN